MLPWIRKTTAPKKMSASTTNELSTNELSTNELSEIERAVSSIADIPLPDYQPSLPLVVPSSRPSPSPEAEEKTTELLPGTTETMPITTESSPQRTSRSSSPSALTMFTSLITGMILSPLPQTPQKLTQPSTSNNNDTPGSQKRLFSTTSPASSRSSSPTLIDPLPLPNKKTRKTLRLNRKQCTYIFKRGQKKNTRCTKLTKLNSLLCCQHDFNKLTPTTSSPTLPTKTFSVPHLPLETKTTTVTHKQLKLKNETQTNKLTVSKTRLRINRLHLDGKYRFIKPVPDRHSVLVRYQGRLLRLRLPQDMEIPKTKGYFIRQKHTNDKARTTFIPTS